MAFPLITRTSADGMLEHPRPSAKSAEKSVVGWLNRDAVHYDSGIQSFSFSFSYSFS